MLINNPEALKSWLIVVLEPLCDADSSALARYVLALVKKDKPEKELKRVTIEQLDVFLAKETESFVERLFNAISTEEYLNLPAIAQSPPVLNAANDETASDEASRAVGSSASVMASSTTTDNVIKTDNNNQQTTSSNKAVAEATNSGAANGSNTTTEPKTKETLYNASKTHESTDRSTVAIARRSSTHVDNNNIASAGAIYSDNGSHQHQPSPAPHHHHHLRSASPPAARANTAADKENQPRDSRRRRASLRSRSRSRSRSNERLQRRSRSRDRRANEREKNQRQFRNKSPPNADQRHHMSSGGGSRRNFDRRRNAGNNSNGAGHDERGARFVNNSNKNRTNRSNSPRSRSVSPERQRGSGHARSGSTDRHHNLHHQQAPPQVLNPHEPLSGAINLEQLAQQRQRCRDFDEKGYCVRGETCPWDHGVNPVVFEGINNTALISMSLREYNPDAPEIWSRSGAASGAPQPPGGSINPFSGNVRPNAMSLGAVPMVPNTGPAADYGRAAAAPLTQFPFNPNAVATPMQRQLVPIPVVDASGGPLTGSGGGVATGGGAEVGKRRFDLEDSVAIAEGPTKRKLPINSRLGPRVGGANMQHNCSLELRKVPRGLNTIAHLNNHFAKFGKIVNIQVSYDGDPEAAIVTFSTHAEANVAYRSTEAVLNNRFIKVFWHSQDLNAMGDASNVNILPPGGGRKNASQYHLHNVPAVPTPSADSAKTTNSTSGAATSQQPAGAAANATNADGATSNILATSTTTSTTTTASTTDATAATTASPASLRLKHNVPVRSSGGASAANVANAAVIRKKQEQAVVQLAKGLRKRKQELLQGYVKQMKTAIELLERCEPQDPQRAKTRDTINVLQGTIEKLRKEISAEQELLQAQIIQQQQHVQNQPPSKKTKEQQKKELLDIELELIAQQQEGNDTSALQKRLEDLQRSLGILPVGGGVAGVVHGAAHTATLNAKVPTHYAGSSGGIGAGNVVGNGAGGVGRGAGNATRPPRAAYPEGSTRVDRRPKAIVVTGFAAEDADFVLGHFKHFGEITKHDVDREIPQLILSYATRINAEQAVLRGKIFKDKRLQISWAPVIQPAQIAANAAAAAAAQKLNPINEQSVVVETDATIVATKLDVASNGKQTLKSSVSESGTLDGANDTLPELRLEDEEEDDESEDRSWRR